MSFDAAGGGRAGTDWNGHDVPAMWALLQNQETEPHWKRVSGWREAFELTSKHMSRLREYREKLAAAWPPKPGSASAVYVAQLDHLISHVEQTYEVAVTNYDAFAAVTSALSVRRNELKKLYAEYETNRARLADYDLQVAAARDPANSGLPQPTLGPPPVPSQRQEELNRQARQLMYSLSSELIDARTRIRQPAEYAPHPGRDPGGVTGSDGPPVVEGRPPIIPPIVPGPAIGGTPTRTTSPVTPGGVGAAAPPGAGPVLGGAGPAAPAPPMVYPALPGPPPTPGAPAPGIIGPLPPVMPVPTPGKLTMIGPTSVPVTPGTRPPLDVVKPMPPGGVIGRPGVGRGAFQADQSARHVNPVGGLIGPTPAHTSCTTPGTGRGRADRISPTATGSTGARITRVTGLPASMVLDGRIPGTGIAGQPSPAVRRSGRRSNDEQGQGWDPENPWKTAEGVDPVVLPPPDPGPVDPGPAIGLER